MKKLLKKEWIVVVSALFFIFSIIYTKHFPLYSLKEFKVLFILLILFVTVRGLEESFVLFNIAQKIEKGKFIAFKLVLTTFFLSMFVTNDVALVVMVPLTIALNIQRKDIVVILEALSANASSALTPFGNPQNLFIYYFYELKPMEFMKTIAPFVFVFFVLLGGISLFLKIKSYPKNLSLPKVDKKAYIYLLLLFVVLSIVLHLLPIYFGILILIFAIVYDRKALLIDYGLLLSFLLFFGIADNFKSIIFSDISHQKDIFLYSMLLSQLISNVPATLLFTKITANWQDLLWGVSAGGFGTLVGSLANLIAYKLYLKNKTFKQTLIFTGKFLFFNFLALFISICIYYLLKVNINPLFLLS